MANANNIHATMTAISDQLNVVGPAADPAKVAQLNQALADWQDFYWANYEQWPVNELQLWADNVDNLAVLLKQLQAQGGVYVDAPVSAPATNNTPIVLGGETVGGTWPTWMKVASSAVLLFSLYAVARRKKWL